MLKIYPYERLEYFIFFDIFFILIKKIYQTGILTNKNIELCRFEQNHLIQKYYLREVAKVPSRIRHSFLFLKYFSNSF